MSTNPFNQQIYPGLTTFPTVQQATIRIILDRIHSLEGRPSDPGTTFRQNPNLGKKLKITNSIDPTDPQDLATKHYVDTAVPAGSSSTASAGTVTVGTHVQRIATAATGGALFFESDRFALYVSVNGVWVLGGSYVLFGQFTLRPTGLTANDAGFLYGATDQGVIYRWSGTGWNLNSGVRKDLFANRPDPTTVDVGGLFSATDRGLQTWVKDFALNGWFLLEGWGEAMRGGLPIPVLGLGANDVGFRYASLDFDREYRWGGTTWADAPGQPTRGMIVPFGSNPGVGWFVANGSSNVTASNNLGGVSTITVANVGGSYQRL